MRGETVSLLPSLLAKNCPFEGKIAHVKVGGEGWRKRRNWGARAERFNYADVSFAQFWQSFKGRGMRKGRSEITEIRRQASRTARVRGTGVRRRIGARMRKGRRYRRKSVRRNKARPCSFEAASNMEIKVAIRVKVLVSPLPPRVYCSLESLLFLSLLGPARCILPVLLPSLLLSDSLTSTSVR